MTKTFLASLSCAVALLLAPFSLAADVKTPGATRPSVSEEACPLVVIEAPTRDNQKATAVIRTPPGNDRRPAIIFLHGGLNPMKLDILKKDVLFQPNQCRFLAAGYITVTATFRSRAEDPQTRDALIDCLAIVDFVKKLPRVDPKSIVVFGGSGGGSLALELAGEAELCAVAAGEPASVLFTGMLGKDIVSNSQLREERMNTLMDHPRRFYTPELQSFTEQKIKQIGCPVFIVHSDVHLINKINNEIVIPTMRELGKSYEVMFVPGQQHGFYNGYVLAAGMKVYDALAGFYSRHIVTPPTPIDRSLITFEPVVHPGPRVERDPSAKARRTEMQEKAKKREAQQPGKN